MLGTRYEQLRDLARAEFGPGTTVAGSVKTGFSKVVIDQRRLDGFTRDHAHRALPG